MELLQEIMRNHEGMFWYQIMSLCIGIIFIVCREEERIWYKISVYSACVADAFLWGSMLLFRLYFNKTSFFLGGVCGVILTILLFVLKKGSEKYLLCFWCQVKVCLIVGNYVIEHYSEKQEETIFLAGMGVALAMFVFMLISTYVCARRKKESMSINGVYKVFSVIYGAALVTGCIYEAVYDPVTGITKFLNLEEDYINFYRVLCKVDWTEEETRIFFGSLCLGFIIIGLTMCKYKKGRCKERANDVLCLNRQR